MIFSHEKEAVKSALYIYMQEISSGRVNIKEHYEIIQRVYNRLKNEHDPIGGFCFGDYKSYANNEYEGGYDLTDEQVNDLMRASKKMFDAEIGMNWDVMSIHIDEWASENNIQKPIDNDDKN